MSIVARGSVLYVSGYEYNGAHVVAKVWKNTTGTTLTHGTSDALALSVFEFENDVYVAGLESNGTKNVAKIWKNGEPIILTNGAYNAQANAVFVVKE